MPLSAHSRAVRVTTVRERVLVGTLVHEEIYVWAIATRMCNVSTSLSSLNQTAINTHVLMSWKSKTRLVIDIRTTLRSVPWCKGLLERRNKSSSLLFEKALDWKVPQLRFTKALEAFSHIKRLKELFTRHLFRSSNSKSGISSLVYEKKTPKFVRHCSQLSLLSKRETLCHSQSTRKRGSNTSASARKSSQGIFFHQASAVGLLFTAAPTRPMPAESI